MSVKISFVIGAIPDDDLRSLKEGFSIIAKMILSPEDSLLFNYAKGHLIQVETEDGNRAWCTILDVETVKNEDHALVIFKLEKSTGNT